MADTEQSAQDDPTTATDLKSYLLNIATEIFEQVAESAQPKDLKALRLASRDTNQKSLRTFAEAYFTERAHLLCSKRSLTVLLNIAKHPTFARSMRTVVLCDDEMDSENVHTPAPKLSTSQRKAFRAQIDEFQDGNLDLHILTTIFAYFRLVDNPIGIQVLNSSQTLLAVQGDAELLQFLSGFQPENRPVEIVLQALQLSALDTIKLAVHHHTWVWSLFDDSTEMLPVA